MKIPITLRLDPALLAAARAEAERDSRTLTNLLELAIKRYLETAAPGSACSATGGDGSGPSAGLTTHHQPSHVGKQA